MRLRAWWIVFTLVSACAVLSLGGCIFSGSSLPARSPYLWTFTRNSPSTWTVSDGSATVTTNGRLRVLFSGATVLYSPPNLRLDPRQYNVLIVRAKTWNDDDVMVLLWQRGTRVVSATVPIVNSGDDVRSYYFDLAHTEPWESGGLIQQVALKPSGQGAMGPIEIEQIEMLPMTLSLQLKVYWEEFLTPEYLSQFGKLLSVAGPQVAGHPINALIYWVLGLCILPVVAVYVLGRAASNQMRRLNVTAFVLCCVAVWLVLSVRFGADEWHTVQRDVLTFNGKPMLDKQSALLSGSYRRFLQFAQDTLPADSRVRLIVNDLAFWMGQYYLYPVRVTEAAPLYLVYDFPNGEDHFQFDASSGTLVRISGKNGKAETIGTGLALRVRFDENGAIYEAKP